MAVDRGDAVLEEDDDAELLDVADAFNNLRAVSVVLWSLDCVLDARSVTLTLRF